MDKPSIYETKVLLCNPLSIEFTPESSLNGTPPSIADPATVSALQTASQILQSSSLVVFPTETVYGLAANALSPSATAAIFTTKGRPQDNPLIVHISSQSMLSQLVSPTFVMPHSYEVLMRTFWPGALTLLFPSSTDVPSTVTAGLNTVAIRMPSHPVARALIALSGLPLAAPSANTSGRPSPTRAIHVKNDLDGKVQLILDGGECDVGVESTVVDGLGPDGHLRVLRPGGVTVEDLKRVLDGVIVHGEPIKVLVHRKDYVDEEVEKQPTTPGMKYRHYSPTCPVYLLMDGSSKEATTPLATIDALLEEVLVELSNGRERDIKDKIQIGLLSLTNSALTRTLLRKTFIIKPPTATGTSPPPPQGIQIEWIPHELGIITYEDGAEGTYDLAEPARRLFDGLISLDGKGVDLIFVEGVMEEREGLAVMNRVRKAAGRVCWLRVDAE
ncbi:hypothetical protein M408DRAFT_330899 [Serendipita vermifera MAFF 305830]|uniref:Threonylcarbamoyl-AMP synthase n=1 Tax=Serendipita vermifera MAFF 305830 TaxID=933852 RepID=A0A0C3B2Z1_SERVB|nr:hypothetical protein M408DRAFT_330899 [Serendipita vermifera MAFF 305830]